MTDAELCSELHRRAGHRGKGFRAWFARIIEVEHTTVYRWHDDDWPSYARVILLLMSKTKPKDWPEEWRK